MYANFLLFLLTDSDLTGYEGGLGGRNALDYPNKNERLILNKHVDINFKVAMLSAPHIPTLGQNNGHLPSITSQSNNIQWPP